MPKRLWEWAIFFSPAVTIWVATLLGWVYGPPISIRLPPSEPPGDVKGAMIGVCIALVVSVLAALHFSPPHPRWSVWAAFFLFTAFELFAVNFTIAFAGYVLERVVAR